jgi:hypothetical protein
MKKTVGTVLDNLFEETIKAGMSKATMNEKEKQDEKSDELSLFGDDEGGGEEESQEPQEPSKTVDDSEQNLKGETPEIDDVVEKLNTIRSGRSLKDDEVMQKFEEYYESLKGAEKTALFAFLEGIGQIVTGDLPAHQATDPEEDGGVKMHKGKKIQKVSIKPNVIQKPSPPEAKVTSSETEDTTPPAPVKPVKRN